MDEIKHLAADNDATYSRLMAEMQEMNSRLSYPPRPQKNYELSENVVNNDYFCYWCHEPNHLKRHCRIYHSWKNSRIQIESVKSENVDVPEANFEQSMPLKQEVRVKIDLINGLNSKTFWLIVPDENMTMLDFRKVIFNHGKCEFDSKIILFLDGYEFLDEQTVKILHNDDTIRCFVQKK